jgi:hypothetical protein
MSFEFIACNLGALTTAFMGAFGLLAPRRAAELVSIKPVGDNGISEIRATYGGLFLALGVLCLFSQTPTFFIAAGVAWVGAACGRLFSILFDKNNDARNFGGLCLELVVGLLLLAPAWQ